MNSFSEIWKLSCDYIKSELNITIHVFDLWLAPVKPISFDGKKAVFFIKNDFTRDVVSAQFTEIIKKALAHTLGFGDFELEFLNYDESEEEEAILKKTEQTFENFIVGPENKFAYAAALAVAKNPGVKYNPLYIYGRSGLGKTHLLKAIKDYIEKNDPAKNVIYITSENFGNDLISHIQSKSMEVFREKYRKCDVLLIDDIQFIANRSSMETEFFNTFNDLHENNKQIIITSDKNYEELPLLEERLRTRFEWGLPADIKSPDIDTRLAIIKSKSKNYGFDLSNDVSIYIAEKAKNNVRQIEGALKKLYALCMLTSEEPSLEMAKEAVKEMLDTDRSIEKTMDNIISGVAETFGVSDDDMLSEKRDKDILNARQLAMYVIRENTGMPLADIGKKFGGKKHTTVKHAIDVVKQKTAEDKGYSKLVDTLIKNMKEI